MIRNFGLDLLRAISIWLVLLQHAGFNITGLQPLKIGGIGVEIFFVISGYLIGGILFYELAKGGSLSVTLKRFWVRRWMRILPLYYLILTVKFCLDSSIGWNLLYYLFFLQNNFYGIEFFEVSWSLVIEEWFYIFSPIFLYYVLKAFKNPNSIIVVIIVFIGLVSFARFGYVLAYDVPYEGVNGNAPFRFDSLFIGVLLSFIERNTVSFFQVLKELRTFVIGMLLFFGYIYYYWSLSFPGDLINQSLFPRTCGFLLLPLSIGLMLPFIATLKDFRQDHPIVKVITLTSVLTYGIYLIHPFVYNHVLKNDSIEWFALKFAFSIGLVYLSAFLVYNLFEKPVLRLRDFLVPRK